MLRDAWNPTGYESAAAIGPTCRLAEHETGHQGSGTNESFNQNLHWSDSLPAASPPYICGGLTEARDGPCADTHEPFFFEESPTSASGPVNTRGHQQGVKESDVCLRVPDLTG
jgi:hypothetical protein